MSHVENPRQEPGTLGRSHLLDDYPLGELDCFG